MTQAQVFAIPQSIADVFNTLYGGLSAYDLADMVTNASDQEMVARMGNAKCLANSDNIDDVGIAVVKEALSDLIDGYTVFDLVDETGFDVETLTVILDAYFKLK